MPHWREHEARGIGIVGGYAAADVPHRVAGRGMAGGGSTPVALASRLGAGRAAPAAGYTDHPAASPVAGPGGRGGTGHGRSSPQLARAGDTVPGSGRVVF